MIRFKTVDMDDDSNRIYRIYSGAICFSDNSLHQGSPQPRSPPTRISSPFTAIVHLLAAAFNELLRSCSGFDLKISIAVAALAVHVPAEDWGDGGIVKWLRDEMDSHPEYIPGFLELLTVLPEVLEAFALWLRLKHGILRSVLSTHQLVLTALSSLNSEFLSEASVNVKDVVLKLNPLLTKEQAIGFRCCWSQAPCT
ncbi:transportin [Arachis hypogaea]|nr:transportin [Arachis hypogaea]